MKHPLFAIDVSLHRAMSRCGGRLVVGGGGGGGDGGLEARLLSTIGRGAVVRCDIVGGNLGAVF